MENKTSKYFKYAIGEIILVVIGILIAINLNNNNQARINKNELNIKLTKLRQVIYKDSLTFSFCINNSKAKILEIDKLIDLIKPDMIIDDYKTMVNLFVINSEGYRTFITNQTVYNELINSGDFSKIEDPEMKENISDLYSKYNHYNGIIDQYFDGLVFSKNNLFSQGIIAQKHFSNKLNEAQMEKAYLEFLELINHPKEFQVFENYIYEMKAFHKKISYFYKGIIDDYMKKLPLKPEEHD